MWTSQMPSIIEDKIRVDIRKMGSYTPHECYYDSIRAVNLREEISQRNNAQKLEEIKEHTYGYYSSGDLYLWGCEQVKTKNCGIGANKLTGQYMHPDLMKLWREKQKREQK